MKPLLTFLGMCGFCALFVIWWQSAPGALGVSQTHAPAPRLTPEYAMRITDYCLTLRRYADAVRAERGRVSRAFLLSHAGDTSLAYLAPRGKADATDVIHALHDNPGMPAPLEDWQTCHAALRP
jgi:hypothetical protein